MDESTVTQLKRLKTALRKQNDEVQAGSCLYNYPGLQLNPGIYESCLERWQLVWALGRWFGPLTALWWYYWRLQCFLSENSRG